jgi:hypothetical protein
MEYHEFVSRLNELKRLHEDGTLDYDEFVRAKRRFLGSDPPEIEDSNASPIGWPEEKQSEPPEQRHTVESGPALTEEQTSAQESDATAAELEEERGSDDEVEIIAANRPQPEPLL